MPDLASNSPNFDSDESSNAFDIAFSVPFTHRVRFTNDVAQADFSVLRQLLHGDQARNSRVLLLGEENVARASDSLSRLNGLLEQQADVDLVAPLITISGGEGIKNDSRAVELVLSLINTHNLDRRSYVVAVGGGAFLDAVGYGCAIAHRGVRLVRIPTTTLAQADSGVGVKNAINYFGKKNWVGTFAVPWAVINDRALLDTLPDRDFRCGFSEAVKVSSLKDADKFDWLCNNAHEIANRNMEVATEAIKISCAMHLRHITEGGDAFEAREARPLDFGHWSAHRLEAMSAYRITHGEAVAIGVAIDSIYSHLAFGFPKSDMMRICTCLHDLRLPIWHTLLEQKSLLLQGLEEFRQHLGGRLTVTMLKGIGVPIDVHEIDSKLMCVALRKLHEISTSLATPGSIAASEKASYTSETCP